MSNPEQDYIQVALDLVLKRHQQILAKGPNNLEPMYNSIVRQLEYFYKIVTEVEKDRAKMWDLTFGMYAAKEFENADELFDDRLSSAFYIADPIRNGLKVQLPHEVDKEYYKKQSRLATLYPENFKYK